MAGVPCLHPAPALGSGGRGALRLSAATLMPVKLFLKVVTLRLNATQQNGQCAVKRICS